MLAAVIVFFLLLLSQYLSVCIAVYNETVDDFDTRISYISDPPNTWIRQSLQAGNTETYLSFCLSGTLSSARGDGLAAIFTFQGTAVYVRAYVREIGANFSAILDGNSSFVSLTGPDLNTTTIVWGTQDLDPNMTHNITLVKLHEDSSYQLVHPTSWLSIDAFIITHFNDTVPPAAPAPPSPSSPSAPKHSHIPIGPIVGGAIGGVTTLLLLSKAAVYFLRRFFGISCLELIGRKERKPDVEPFMTEVGSGSYTPPLPTQRKTETSTGSSSGTQQRTLISASTTPERVNTSIPVLPPLTFEMSDLAPPPAYQKRSIP